jgi:hypothetical protein
MLALPALWYGSLTMLLAVIALRDPSTPGAQTDLDRLRARLAGLRTRGSSPAQG